MLSLDAPFHLVRGIAVFADHAHRRQFYYLPAMPHLTTTVDPATGEVRPQLQLLRYRGSDAPDRARGGFLSFTVDLGVDDTTLAVVRKEVKRVFDVSDDPILSPVVLEDGGVRLVVLGRQSGQPVDAQPGDDDEPAPTAPDRFVVRMDHPAKPALYGDNQAVFSVELDEEGAVLVERSLQGHMMPIGIVYDLEFLGLRPAFSVRVHADWERVQKHLQERSDGRVLFFSTEVDTIVDELVEDRAIVIEVDNFVPEGDDAANVISDPRAALEQVKEMVLETFFEPSINPVSTEEDGWDKASDVALRLSTLAVTGGWAGVATFSHKKVDLTRIDRKRFDFSLRERTAVRRRIYPQAHLEGLSRFLRAGGVPRSDLIVDVDLDSDPFFAERTVKVVNRADLKADGIASIDVTLHYGTKVEHVTLEEGHEQGTVVWPLAVGGATDVRASYVVRFAGVDTLERPASVTSGELVLTGQRLEVDPRRDGLYHVVNVPVTALEFPWERYPSVEVELGYADPEEGIDQQDVVSVDELNPTRSWRWFLRDRERSAFDYRCTYRAADHRDWSTGWTRSTREDVLLRDPRPSRRTVTVIPALSWELVAMVFVDLAYRDETNGVQGEASLQFTKEQSAAQPFVVSLADPEQRLVTYSVKLLFTDHSLVELPPSATLQNQLVIRSDMRGHRILPVRPDAVDFAARKVREVQAKVRYLDEANGLDYSTPYTFTSAGARGFFEFDYVDLGKQEVTVESKTLFTNGFAARKPPRTVTATELVVPVG